MEHRSGRVSNASLIADQSVDILIKEWEETIPPYYTQPRIIGMLVVWGVLPDNIDTTVRCTGYSCEWVFELENRVLGFLLLPDVVETFSTDAAC